MSMGFMSKPDKPAPRRTIGKIAIEFDSGSQIAINDLAYHTMISGATGSGKTTSAGSEIVKNAIAAGLPLVIMDPKCNFGDKVRGFAKSCGREKDIVEFGSFPSATPINILANRDEHELYEFFLLMLDSVIPFDHNRSFHLKGVRYAADCANFLRFMTRHDPAFTPTVGRIAEMIAAPDLASAVFRKWRDNFYDKGNEKETSFLLAVQADRFHTLNRVEKKKQAYVSSTVTNSDTTMAEQYSFANHALASALMPLMRSPGFIENFCDPQAPAPDFKSAFEKNSIVHIRFEPSCGQSGALLSRLLLSEAYKALYDIGLTLKKQIIFFCDEFQSFCDLGGGRYSDAGFVERAREYGGSLVACTQSASGLVARYGAAAVTSFYNNINNLICLYSTDPLTCALAKNHDPNVELSTLEFGQAFVKTFSVERRAHESGIEKLNQAWERSQAVQPVPTQAIEKKADYTSFTALATREEKEQEVKQEEKKPEKKLVFPKKEREKVPPDHFCQELMRDFPQLFAKEPAGEFAVPLGWRQYVRQVFSLCAAMDTKAGISAMKPFRNRMDIDNDTGSLYVLRELLEKCEKICMICGCEEATELGVCESCLDRYGLTYHDDSRPDIIIEEEI